MAEPDKIVRKILEKKSECDYTGVKDSCIPEPFIDKIRVVVVGHGSKAEVLEKAKKKLGCDSEACIVKKVADKIGVADVKSFLNKYFKPLGPEQKFGLLSNVNIDNVLAKMAEQFKHRKFLHIPYQMRDFDTVKSELASVDIAKEFASGYKTFGVVLNTDLSTGPGIHWFCLFGEKEDNKVQLEYFNSSGRPPLEEVQIVLNRMKNSLEKNGNAVRIQYSTGINFQSDDHSCGVYCCAYIWFRLLGVAAQWFRANNFNDGLMHLMREYIFRPRN